jgi:hypothetical protein
VTVKTAGSSDEMVSLMNAGGFDLVTASGDASLRLIAGNTVQEINTALISDWSKVDPNLQSAIWHTVNGKHYGVPWQWGANVLMYNAGVFENAPQSWSIVFEEQKLPDGKSNKGRVEAYYGPIYIADAALYLMTHKPELGIQDPYALTKPQFDAASSCCASSADREQILGRCAAQVDDFTSEGVVASTSWPYQVNTLRAGGKVKIGSTGAEGGRHRLGRHHHDACRGAASELRLHVAEPLAVGQCPGGHRGVVRQRSGGPGLLRRSDPDRRRLQDQRHPELQARSLLENPGARLWRRPRMRAVPRLGRCLSGGAKRQLSPLGLTGLNWAGLDLNGADRRRSAPSLSTPPKSPPCQISRSPSPSVPCRATMAPSGRSTMSASTSWTASSSPCSAPPARARPPACA